MIKTKVLIVEDEFLLALVASDLLKLFGYTVCGIAASGEEAIQITEQEHPDVVLMDIHLPGNMDGIETARQIRSHFGSLIVYTTGYIEQEIQEQAQATEPIGYFVKPVDYRKLHNVIQSAIQKQKKRYESR